MGYLNCPSCARRLRVPDSLSPMELQCPACRHTFRSDGVALEEAPARASAEAPAAGAEAAPAGPDAAGRILSKADESMLRDYGSGSGLLELTREAMSLSANGAASPQAAPAAAPAPAGPSAGETDRQFQIVGTALTLANKLVLAHKLELGRSRRHAALGWSLLAAMTLAAAAAGWWAVRQSGLTELERMSAGNLAARLQDANVQLAEHRGREPIAAEELATVRKDLRAAQTELSAAKEALAEAKQSLAQKSGAVEALTAKLETADARAAALADRVQRLQADLAAAQAGPASSSGELTSPGPSTRPTTMPASAPARPTPDVGEAHLVPDK